MLPNEYENMIDLIGDIREFEDEIIGIRRRIHQHPELSFKEFETARVVAQKLRAINFKVRTGVGGNGVIGLLKGSLPGNVVGLRADMDALPVVEGTDVPFKSKKRGVMHACGHDTHVAMLLGCAMLLDKHRDELHGAVKFLFQPAEEHGGLGGAKPMIDDGAMRNPKVDYVFGLHISSALPSNMFALRPGPIMATPDSFRIRIIGKGGHGSAPDETVDPVFVSAQLITALQGISSRMIDPRKPFVVSVCSIHAGSKDNVIPDDSVIEGTIRTLEAKVRTKARRNFTRIVNSVCRAFNATCELNFTKDVYPITYNNPMATKRVTSILRGIKGTRTIECDPILGAEDFSRFLQKAPGTYYFLGTRNPNKGCIYPNHSSKFKVDESVLKYGSVSLAEIAIQFTET
jgi:carboxypeptidase Ss1